MWRPQHNSISTATSNNVIVSSFSLTLIKEQFTLRCAWTRRSNDQRGQGTKVPSERNKPRAGGKLRNPQLTQYRVFNYASIIKSTNRLSNSPRNMTTRQMRVQLTTRPLSISRFSLTEKMRRSAMSLSDDGFGISILETSRLTIIKHDESDWPKLVFLRPKERSRRGVNWGKPCS